jgi:hypothetical protein
MGRRKGQVRFGYKKLSPAYRKRLASKGISQREWEMGSPLQAARGHAREGLPKISKSQQQQIDRAVRADLTPQELKQLDRVIIRPKWIPKNMEIRTEVIAALSGLPDPKTWKHAYLTPHEPPEPWTLTIYRKRSKIPIVIEIPGGGGGEGEAPREVIDILQRVNLDYSDKALPNSPDPFWTVMDTDRRAPKK